MAEVYAALVTAVRDYVAKNGFASAILALSGGIDSALTATIAADAIGPQNVHVVLMLRLGYIFVHPVSDAEDSGQAGAGRARPHEAGIQPMVDAFQAELDLTGLAAENLQARVRGVILMGLSNAEGHLALTTGNKSELATGYSTLYGDSAGGFGPIKDVPKTLVWDLARWRNADAASRGETPPIPENSITKPPSAELSPGQLDSDSLPDYPVLDALLDDYVVKDLGVAELVAAGHDPALVDRVVAMVDWPSTSGVSTCPAPRSPRVTSAGTAGSPSRTGGGNRAGPCPADIHRAREDELRHRAGVRQRIVGVDEMASARDFEQPVARRASSASARHSRRASARPCSRRRRRAAARPRRGCARRRRPWPDARSSAGSSIRSGASTRPGWRSARAGGRSARRRDRRLRPG